MKKTALAIAVLLMLALPTSAIAGTLHEFYDFVTTVMPVPEGTKLPVVTIFNPQNNTFHTSNNLQVNFSATTEKSNNISLTVNKLYYITSWQEKRTDIDMKQFYFEHNSSYPSTFNINITNVPEGPCWLQVYAVANAFAYETGRELTGTSGPMKFYTIYCVFYESLSSSTAKFTIDTTIPNILSLSMENKTYDTTKVPFILTTNEPVQQVAYSLDEQANVTVTGNTTLTDLSPGNHSIKVYAWDDAGNVGSSETLTFIVAEPFPIVPATLAIATIVTVSASLLIYFRKRRGEAKTS